MLKRVTRVLASLLPAIALLGLSPVSAEAEGRSEGSKSSTSATAIKTAKGARGSASKSTRTVSGSTGAGSGSGGYSEPCGQPGLVLCRVWTSEAPGVDVTVVSVEIATELELPEPTIGFGPDPAGNKWNMIPVGYPMWLWTQGRSAFSSTASEDALTVTLNATPGPTAFTMGDGGSVTCTDQPTWIKGNTQKSPCSYTYQYPSPEDEPYVVTATTTWTVHWYAADESGTLTIDRTATRELTVGELHSLRER